MRSFDWHDLLSRSESEGPRQYNHGIALQTYSGAPGFFQSLPRKSERRNKNNTNNRGVEIRGPAARVRQPGCTNA